MALPVEEVNDSARRFINDMIDTLLSAKGIGLASTQVGENRRIILLDVPDREESVRGSNLLVLINPVITESYGEIIYEEGCLSIPGFTADVKRASNVVVDAIDREGRPFTMEMEGLGAVAVQHEVDHLDGLLFIDRLSRIKREFIKRKIKRVLANDSKKS